MKKKIIGFISVGEDPFLLTKCRGYNKLNSVGVQSPTDDKKDVHGFGKEICLLAQTESGAQVSRCET
jgi:hypothetical protein